MPRINRRLYVGLCIGGNREVFRYHMSPTTETHGEKYLAVIGPFRTRGGAVFMRDNGRNNPHCQTVGDAERLSKALKADKIARDILGQ